jgi:hypothetical protein
MLPRVIFRWHTQGTDGSFGSIEWGSEDRISQDEKENSHLCRPRLLLLPNRFFRISLFFHFCFPVSEVYALLDAYTKVTDEFFNEMEKVRKEFKQILKDEQLTKNAENKLESSNREIDVIGKKQEKKQDLLGQVSRLRKRDELKLCSLVYKRWYDSSVK